MFGIGSPELIVLVLLGTLVFGMAMTVDAVRRPPDRYTFGPKGGWVALFAIANPFVARLFGGLAWIVAVPVFLIGSVVYYIGNRRKNPIRAPRPSPEA
jgi:uncharacterized membrane protein YjjP (DUF1212 family)